MEELHQEIEEGLEAGIDLFTRREEAARTPEGAAQATALRHRLERMLEERRVNREREGMFLVIQEIETCWTKASRGGQGAVRRNAVPEALPLPPVELAGRQVSVVHHRALFLEAADFAQPREELVLGVPVEPVHAGCVTITPGDGLVRVAFEYRTDCGGAPERGWIRKTLSAGAEEWVRMAYNGRFSTGWDCYWSYRKRVVNVGWFSRLSREVFLDTPPADLFRAMAHLW